MSVVPNVEENKDKDSEDVVTPWDVLCSADTGIDYEKLISKFFSLCVAII